MNSDLRRQSNSNNNEDKNQSQQNQYQYQSNSQRPPKPNYDKEQQGGVLPQIKINISNDQIDMDNKQINLSQNQNMIETLGNKLNQSNQIRLNEQMMNKGRTSLSPNFPKEILCEEDRFTFDQIQKELQNRDKVDSYHSATFRKGSELNQITQQNSQANSQNDLSLNNSQSINVNSVGRSIYKRGSSGKQNQDQQSQSQLQQQSQLSMIVPPYIKINTRIITHKQFVTLIKDNIKYDYSSILLGICKFSELYYIIENKKKHPNLNQISLDALQLYDNKFQGIKPTKQYDFKADFDKYQHNISQKFLYQKMSSFGRQVERQACICEGKIKQPIPDKDNKNREAQNSILQSYKEKVISKVHLRIEQKGQANNFSQLKWTTNPQKKYRILYQDNKKAFFAVYTDTLEEAIKLRDYSICFNIEDQEKTLSPMGIFRLIAVILPKMRIVQQFRQKLKIYAEYQQSQESKVINEVSMEESPQQRHPQYNSNNSNNYSDIQGQNRKSSQLIQLEPLEIGGGNNNNNSNNNNYNQMKQYNSDKEKDIVKNLLQEQQTLGIQKNSIQIEPQITSQFASKQNIINQSNNLDDSAEKDIILEDEEENNNIRKISVNESLANQKRGSNINQQIQQQMQNINNQNNLNFNSKDINNTTNFINNNGNSMINQSNNFNNNLKNQINIGNNSISNNLINQQSQFNSNLGNNAINQSSVIANNLINQQNSINSFGNNLNNNIKNQQNSINNSIANQHNSLNNNLQSQTNSINNSITNQSSNLNNLGNNLNNNIKNQSNIINNSLANQQNSINNIGNNLNNNLKNQQNSFNNISNPINNVNSINNNIQNVQENINNNMKDQSNIINNSVMNQQNNMNINNNIKSINFNTNNSQSNNQRSSILSNGNSNNMNQQMNNTNIFQKNQFGQQQQQQQFQIQNNGPPPNISQWNQQDSKIHTFKSDMIRDTVYDESNLTSCHYIKEYDRLFFRSFGEQLKLKIRNIADEQITFIKHKVQTMREQAENPVDIFLTFHQIQFEFKNESDQQDMILKPKLRLQINEESDNKQQQNSFMVELQSRVCSKKGKIKEFELFGEKKIATISNIKLFKMKRNEIKIEIIDEITDSIIARNSIKMEKILSRTEFMNLQLTIEPVQLLTDKLIIQLHLQTYIQQINLNKQINQDNEFQEEDEDQLSNIFDQNLKIVPKEVPQNIEEYLERTLFKQNYITDNFYQSKLFLEHFSPSQFNILIDLITSKGINTTQLQLSLRKHSNKLECYSSIRVCLYKYYMEKQSQHQSLLAKNTSGWNQLYDEIVSQADQIEYGNEQNIGNNYLDTSDGFILRDAVEEMRVNEENGADQYLYQMQSQRGSLTLSQQLQNQTNRRIVTSIFYKRDLWEQDSSQYIFYQKMVQLASKGIPNPLRQTLWLELGKANKYAYIIDELLRTYYFDLPEDTQQNKKSYVYKNLVKRSYNISMEQSKQNQISEMQDDIEWYKNNSLYMNEQTVINLTNIFYAYCHYVQLQAQKVIYSKYLIPLACKAIDYFKSESEDSDTTIEENVFWLIVCFTNNFAKRYFNTKQMIETAQNYQLGNVNSNNTIQKSAIVANKLVQSSISTLPANNTQNNQQKQPNTLNYIPDDIRLDMLIFEYYLKEKNEKFSTFLSYLSFGVGIYFAERMLCFFSDLFNHELLFRLWDYLFLEGSSKNPLKTTYFGMSIMINFLNKISNQIMNVCRSRKEVLLYIKLAAKFEVNCDEFLAETIIIYNNFIQNEPHKFPKIENNNDQNQEGNNPTDALSKTGAALAKTTKRILNSIINVSKNFFNQTLQKHLESIDLAYQQLDMQRYLNQMMFIQTLVDGNDSLSSQSKIDLNILTKTIDELGRDINKRRKQQSYSSQSSNTQTFNQVKAADRSFQDLNQAQMNSNNGVNDSNIQRRGRSTSQISFNSQINQQNNNINNKLESIKPVQNFYSKPPIIQKIFLNIHQIQMVEDYNELTIKISINGITKTYTVKKLNNSQIIDCFEINTLYKQYFGQKSNTFGSQYQANQQQQQIQGMSNQYDSDNMKMTVEIYENINGISHPLKQARIDIGNYQPDVITKDYNLLYDLQEFEEQQSQLNNNSQPFFNRPSLNQSNLNNQFNQHAISTQQNLQSDLKNPNKTNYTSGIEYTILMATSYGLGEYDQFKNNSNNNNINGTRKFSSNSNNNINNVNSMINSNNTGIPSNSSNPLFLDKFNFVPDIMQVRKNQQIESKLKQYNQLKTSVQLESITNKSLNSIKHLWKQNSSLTIEEYKQFAESTGLKIWQELNLTELFNHFSFEACVLQVEGRYPEKIELIRKIINLSSPQPSFREQIDNSENQIYDNIGNSPSIYLSMINEIYCKNMLYLPFDQHLNSLKLKNIPYISKAKYFFDYYSIPTHTTKSTPVIQQSVSARQQYGQINDSSCNYGATQSRLSHSIDLTIFLQSFCAQQLQFKGSLDFMLDSQEFINALRNHIKQSNNIDNIPGKLSLFYWSKGQLRQMQAQYGYQTLGLANLNYMKPQKVKLSKSTDFTNQSQVMQYQNMSGNKMLQVFKLLEFNDTLVSLNFDDNEMKQDEINNTFASLPLFSYFNSLQNSLYSKIHKKQQTNLQQTFTKTKQTVFININIDNQSKGSFRLVSSQLVSQDTSYFLDEVQYKNKQLKTILEDWSMIKNVQVPRSSELQDQQQQQDITKVIDMKIDQIPLWLKVDDLARLISYRLMENCINKIEQFSYRNKETFWVYFFNEIKHLDLLENLESVQLLYQQNYHNLDQNMNLQQNLTRKLYKKEKVEDLENICIVLKFKTNFIRQPYLSYFEQPQQYAIFHFKDGGKQWLPCKILGCLFDQSQTHLFLVEFNDFQNNIFKRTEGEISVDQDIKIQQLNYEEMDILNNNGKYQIIDDRSINYNLETQYWDQSQYNGQNNLTQTRNTSNNFVLNTSYINYNDNQRTKPTQITQMFNDTSSFYQPTQGDVRFQEYDVQDEYPIQKTYENLKTQTDLDSPQKNALFQQYIQ